MSSGITLSQVEARDLILHAQGLNTSNQRSLDIIQRLGYVQIDTLAVAERAHHHVFHTRNTDYTTSNLDELMRNKQIFEYWSHAASYLPMVDYRFSLVRKKEYASGKSHWFEQDKKTTKYVLDRIKAEGPLQSKHFKDIRTEKQEWYAWKPAKIALEQLFMEGKLMVAERKNFQKVYDLTERVLPANIDTKLPTPPEYCEYLIKTTLQAQGLATSTEIGYLRKGIKPILEKAINRLIKAKEITKVTIEQNTQTYYALNHSIDLFQNTQVHILSPFDNLVIQRKRLFDIFHFDYQIECYVPEKKRKFGYYCLPVLYGNRFVGRFDPKADRKTGIFTIKSFWWEDNFTPDDEFSNAFVEKLKRFVIFCGCNQLKILESKNDKQLENIERLVNSSI